MNCALCGAENPQHHRFCRGCGAALGGSAGAGAERRQVTVLFADMTGFTAMSEFREPEEIQEIMNVLLQTLASSVYRYGGYLDKYTGDGIMALFGAPYAHEDDPERALAAALEMRGKLGDINRQLRNRLPEPIGLHIGVNTGLVVTGRVGDVHRSDYTALGDTVNLAARLEDKSEDGEILVSNNTHRLTHRAFSFGPERQLTVKGKSEPVKVYNLLGQRRGRRPRVSASDVVAPFVGRGADLARLSEVVARLESGSGGFASVTGPAGVGKTRFLTEARNAARSRPVRWVSATCDSLGKPYAVWLQALRALLNVEGSQSIAKGDTGPVSVQGGTMVFSTRDDDIVDEILLLLGKERSTQERQRLGEADPGKIQDMYILYRARLEDETRRQPLVLLIDDLHWCDSASLNLLRYLLESTSRVPLLIMTSFRGDAEVRIPLEEAVSRVAPPFRVDIDLQPLSAADSHRLAASLVPGDDLDLAEVRERLVEYAEGNPLFMEEVRRAFIDKKIIEATDKGWLVRPRDDVVIVPDTLQGLLLDRIDRLPLSHKLMVQVAAVAGRAFPAALVVELAGAGADAAAAMATLEQAGIIEPALGPGGADYRFRHALMQEAAYNSLLTRNRQTYHRQVAQWYEKRLSDPQPPAGLATILAHHWERAEVWERAAIWALRRADEARRDYALSEASAAYRRALQFADAPHADDIDIRREALYGLGEVEFATGSPQAVDQFTAALALARDPLDRALLERRIGQTLDRDGQLGHALEAFARATALLGEPRRGELPEWAAERARLGVARAFTHLFRGDDEQARAAAEAALHADLPPPDRADASALLGMVFLRGGNAEQAAAHFAEAVELARSADDRSRVRHMLYQLALANTRRGRYDEARHNLQECLSVTSELGDAAAQGRVLLDLAGLDEHDGALVQATERLHEVVRQAAAADEPVLAAAAHLALGRVLGALGDWQGGRAALERAGSDDPDVAGRAALEMALLSLNRNELPEGALRQALEEGQRHSMADLIALARLGLATVARRLRRRDEARAHLRDVLAAAGGADSPTTSAARVILAEVALDERRADTAVAVARRALQAAERTGPAALVWNARRVLGAALSLDGQHDEAEAQLRQAAEAARAARAFPELARCLADWSTARKASPATNGHEPELPAMMAEMREIIAYLAGSAPQPAGATH